MKKENIKWVLIAVSIICTLLKFYLQHSETIQNKIPSKTIIPTNTIEAPSDYWTLDKLNEIFYVNGENITLPININDLLADTKYSLKGERNVGDATFARLYYKDELIAAISYSSDMVYAIAFNISAYLPSQNYENYIYINGCKLGGSVSEIEKQLGKFEMDLEEDGIYRFKIEENPYMNTIIVSTSDEKVVSISIMA